jgi:integrase
MAVRKRSWVTKTGERREAWVVAYTDQAGTRRIATFAKKRDAEAYEAQVQTEVRAGVHTAVGASITVAEAAEDWLSSVELEGRERSTLKTYREHVRLHINPRLGHEKLARLTAPRINIFRDQLLRSVSRTLARKLLITLKAILRDAMNRGTVSQNVALGVRIGNSARDQRKLEIGRDIPTPDEVRRIIQAAPEYWRPLLVVAAFAGLRASELRGLSWRDVNLKYGEIRVRQRADRFNVIGKPKSRAGARSIPFGPFVINTLRTWKLACPKGELELVFPTTRGRVIQHKSLIRSALIPAQLAAGVVTSSGRAKYTGLHTLRHFYASWCINRKADGGLELPAKVVQTRLGHASIVMTLDTYGHLFPRGDDGAELAAAERALGLHTAS